MTDSEGRTSILLVDPYVLFRDGLRGILCARDGLTVVGEASDSAQAVSLAAETRPHVVLLDHDTPGNDIAATVRLICRRSPTSAVIVLSTLTHPVRLPGLLAAGIRGYLPKDSTSEELLSTVQSVRANSERIVLSVPRHSLTFLTGSETTSTVLSGRQREILLLTAQALSNGQIATRLGLTEATVKRHLRNIFSKLGAVSRIDAVNKAVASSLIPAESIGIPLQEREADHH
ncbi:LuxR family two component transcriptional regulator [Prauserella shujinwangii]|uniref:LuxR family two component transcriptional regulator n=1 Tax=Prauserella shujinwangii TaxID=1453103 RepID=A0A2T0M3U3_9PSEU|nr:response regulator transcription factor [Prauserella shujinwangii]PRX51424.1 LuxR family two component transcriptional regulator [Prauserella shujinwangii]